MTVWERSDVFRMVDELDQDLPSVRFRKLEPMNTGLILPYPLVHSMLPRPNQEERRNGSWMNKLSIPPTMT